MTEQESNAILAEYLRRIDAGESVNIDAICEAHPEIADELKSYMDGDAMLEDMLKAEAGDTSQVRAHQETIRPGAAHSTDTELIGQMFGRYKIIRQLGQGAMGAVYLANDTQLMRDVALKIPKFGYGEQQEFITRFQREAQAAANLNHTGICPVFDISEENGSPYITMAFIDGQPLSRFIGTTQVTDQWIIDVIKQIADALAHAHDSGVVHRDLKAGNVLMDTQGKAIVTDFGLARRVDDSDESRITKDGAILGTPGYMSPEQAASDPDKLGPPTDIYALGVMLYELLTGELPFRGPLGKILLLIAEGKRKDPRDINASANAELSELACRMMSKEIADRPASMHDVVAILEGLAGDADSEPDPEDEKRQAQLKKLEDAKQKVGELIGRAQYAQATGLLEKISTITEAHAVGYANWAREELKRVKSLPKKVREGLPALISTAKKLVKKHDYASANEMLQQVPRELRTPELNSLLEKSIDRQDEVDLLTVDLQECVRTKQYDGIEDNVKRLLKLKPNSRFAKNLWEALNTYSSTPAGSRKYRFDEKGKLLPQQSGMNTTLIGVIVFGLLVFAGMSYAMTLYLKSGNETLIVKVDDELLRNGDVTLSFDGKDHTITGPEFTLTVKPGTYGYDITQGNTVIRNPQKFTIVKDGKNVLEIGNSTDKDTHQFAPSNTYLKFSSATDKVILPKLGFDGSNDTTIECWVNVPKVKMSKHHNVVMLDGLLALERKVGDTWRFVVRQNERQFFFAELTEPMALNQWTHLAGVYSQGEVRLYINGEEQETTFTSLQPSSGKWEHEVVSEIPKSPPTWQKSLNSHLGDSGESNSFIGEVDEIRFSNSSRYSTSFTPQRRFVPDNKTLALYHCDESSGTILNDSSGNGHHGKIVGAMWSKASKAKDQQISVINNLSSVQRTPIPDGPPGLVKSFSLGVEGVAVSPDGRYLAAGGKGREINMFEINSGELLWKQSIGEKHTPIVNQLIFIENGQELVATGSSGHLAKFDARTGENLMKYQGHPKKDPPTNSNTPITMRLLLDHSGFVTMARNGTIGVWDNHNPKPRHYFDLANVSWYVKGEVTPDGLLVSGLGSEQIKLLDLETGKTKRNYFNNSRLGAIQKVSNNFLKHGEKGAELVNLNSGKVIRSYKLESHVFASTFTPDGRHLIASTDEPAIRIVEVVSGKEIAIYKQGRSSETLQCTPDGRFLFFGDSFIYGKGPDYEGNKDRKVHLWRLPKACWTEAQSPSNKLELNTTNNENHPFPADARFSNPRPVIELNQKNSINAYPWVSPDGLTIYWTGEGGSDNGIYQAQRPNANAPFGSVKKVADGRLASVSPNGMEIVCLADADGDGRLKEMVSGERQNMNHVFTNPQPITEFESRDAPKGTAFSDDGLTLLVLDTPNGVKSHNAIHRYMRHSTSSRWFSNGVIDVKSKPSEMFALTWPSFSTGADGKNVLLFSYIEDGAPSEEWGGVAFATNASGTFDNPRPILVDGKRVVTRGGRYCAATGELFYTHPVGEVPYKSMEIFVAKVSGPQSTDSKNDFTSALQGHWKVLEENTPSGTNDVAGRDKKLWVNGSRFEITYNAIATPDPNDLNKETGRMVINLAKQPVTIDMYYSNKQGKQLVYRGIIRIENGKVRHRYVKASPSDQTPKRPASFDTPIQEGWENVYERSASHKK